MELYLNKLFIRFLFLTFFTHSCNEEYKSYDNVFQLPNEISKEQLESFGFHHISDDKLIDKIYSEYNYSNKNMSATVFLSNANKMISLNIWMDSLNFVNLNKINNDKYVEIDGYSYIVYFQPNKNKLKKEIYFSPNGKKINNYNIRKDRKVRLTRVIGNVPN